MKLIGTTDPRPQPYEIAHAELSRHAAEEGIVLLKNEAGILPLDPCSPVALFGGGAVRTIKGGRGSGEVNDRYCVSIYEGMEKVGFTITTKKWLDEYATLFDREREAWHRKLMEMGEDTANGIEFFERCYSQTPFIRPEDLPVCRTDADVAIYVISRTAGEAADRQLVVGDYLLTDHEKQTLRDIAEAYSRVVVIVNTGGVIDLSFMDEIENIHGLIYLSQPGMEGGNALATVLEGKVSPSGKLSDTWAISCQDYPSAEAYGAGSDIDTVRYKEGIYVGYRYFDTFGVPVRYGFGYGLSYTQFSIRALTIRQEEQEVCLAVAVTNTGSCAGKEVVQIYATAPAQRQDKELRRLVAFEKTEELQPGETVELELRIQIDSMASYDERQSGWILEAGDYVLWMGDSLQGSVIAAVVRQPEDLIRRCEVLCPCREALSELKPLTRKEMMWKATGDFVLELTLSGAVLSEAHETESSIEAMSRAKELTQEQLLDLVVGDGKIADETDPYYTEAIPVGIGGKITSETVPNLIFCDGPAGVRLSPSYEVKDGRPKKKSMRDCLENGIFAKPLDHPVDELYYQRCTSFPVGTMLAQTWNTKLVRQIGVAIAEELCLFEADVWLAPGINIHRNPLCGRNFEYYSEDPLMTGVMATAAVQGIQSVPGRYATLKHFACNSREDNRMHSDSVISERALREIYCKGFEIAVKNAKPGFIMTAYNKINGVFCANNYDLCTKLARREWGYDGLFVCDWTSTVQDQSCTAAGCMRAGCDLIMPGFEADRSDISRALEEGTLLLEELQCCAARVIQLTATP